MIEQISCYWCSDPATHATNGAGDGLCPSCPKCCGNCGEIGCDSTMIPCPLNDGGYDCTPFCPSCEGNQFVEVDPNE